MGIDKSDIHAIFHYNLPKSLENYSQEIGRAGRDQQPSRCELFACRDDLNALESFAYGDTPSRESIQLILEQVFAGTGDQLDVSLYELSQLSDARQLVVQTLLTYLELDGFLEAGTPYYSKFEMHPLIGSAEILGHFEGERREFLEALFRHSEKRRKWITLDLQAACRAHGAPRDRAVRALDYLSAQGWIELRVLGVRHRYSVLRRPQPEGPAFDQLLDTLLERFERRERAELDRLRQVLSLIEADECQVSRLGAHYSEPLAAPCGHCSWCLDGGVAVEVAPRRVPPMSDAVWQEAAALRAEHPEALGEPRALARFLCGLSSPRQSRARLGSHRLAGALAEVPFDQVLVRARSEA
jgi:ATP-dependent DNA helicase RecQ